MDRPLARTAFLCLLVMLFVAFTSEKANAQRPSIQDMQAQIDALTYPYDEPAAQVRTTLDILPTFQDAVANYYRTTGEAPVDRSDAGLSQNASDTQTSFISEVDIYDGAVVFTFGNDVDVSITGMTLAYTPYTSDDDTIVWTCGDAPPPANTTVMGNYGFTDLPLNLQPDPCILQTQSCSSDDIVRAQVLEPFDVVETIQNAIEAAGIALGSPGAPQAPSDRDEAGLTSSATDTQGQYFDEIDIVNGAIWVRYGNNAHDDIDSYTMTWTPYESLDGTISWRCGYANVPYELNLMGTAAGGQVAVYDPPSVDERYLPFECRSN